MIVSQNMVAEAEIICKKTIPTLDVKYHLCVPQEHNVKIEVSPTTPPIPIFGEVRVSSESISTEISRFESVFSFSWFSICFWIRLRV